MTFMLENEDSHKYVEPKQELNLKAPFFKILTFLWSTTFEKISYVSFEFNMMSFWIYKISSSVLDVSSSRSSAIDLVDSVMFAWAVKGFRKNITTGLIMLNYWNSHSNCSKRFFYTSGKYS